MAPTTTKDLFVRATEPVLARIRADRDRLIYPARGLLEYLISHVFDPDLKVNRWLAACKIKSVTATLDFQTVTGATLQEYLEELRVETAMRLLVLSGGALPCSEVGFLVGYGREATFRGVFERLTGKTPGVYRNQVLALHKLGRRPPDPVWVRSGWLDRLAAENLGTEETLAMIDEIEAAYGIEPGAASAASRIASRADHETWLADGWWQHLRELPTAELERRLLRGFADETPALCEHLLSQVASECRQDPAHGLAAAELALEQALALEPFLSPAELAHLLARAWAWLGYARRFARDEAGAAEAFASARGCLAEHAAPPALLGEIERLEAG